MFSRKSTARTALARNDVGARGTFSILGADLIVRGDVTTSSDLHIDGEIAGDIQCASIVQGERSTIRGAIVAKSARLSGKVVGNVEAADLVVLGSARIEGDLHYDALTIEHGAQVDGRLSRRAVESAIVPALVG